MNLAAADLPFERNNCVIVTRQTTQVTNLDRDRKRFKADLYAQTYLTIILFLEVIFPTSSGDARIQTNDRGLWL